MKSQKHILAVVLLLFFCHTQGYSIVMSRFNHCCITDTIRESSISFCTSDKSKYELTLYWISPDEHCDYIELKSEFCIINTIKIPDFVRDQGIELCVHKNKYLEIKVIGSGEHSEKFVFTFKYSTKAKSFILKKVMYSRNNWETGKEKKKAFRVKDIQLELITGEQLKCIGEAIRLL